MPTLSVEKAQLFQHMNRDYTDEQFDELCFEFGVELDEITSEREEATKSATSKLSAAEAAALSDAVLYKIDVPANRYDLLCVEGLSRALRIFLGDSQSPVYERLDDSHNPETLAMTVKKSRVDRIRPYVVCAVLRDLSFDECRYKSFMDLQDQLHRNICRQRALVAIGTHDLDSVAGPFCYDAKPAGDITFVPLTPDDRGAFTADKLLEYYETDPAGKHLKPYVPIIKDSPVVPVITDSAGTVLSLPPIINGNQSKITLNTKNVFVECTATDLTKANIVLDTVVTMFSEYCSRQYTVEGVPVRYVDDDGNTVREYTTPVLSTRRERAAVSFCNSLIGIDLSPAAMRDLCDKVQLGPAVLLENDTVLEVNIPPTRSDLLHAVDIAEDVGIAYGYNNIAKRVPQTATVGGEFPLNLLTDLLRDEIARAGYIEVLTHGLCSRRDNFTALRRPVDDAAAAAAAATAVSLSNPANVEYEVVRTTLLPGLLKTLQHNKKASFAGGFKLFEISDVVIRDAAHETTGSVVGARNARRVCAAYAGPATSGFEIIHGLVDRIMTLTEVAPGKEYVSGSSGGGGAAAGGSSDEEAFRVTREGWSYKIAELKEGDCPEAATYFPGRAASVVLTKPAAGGNGGSNNEGETMSIGTFGVLHPEVLHNFDIQYPASCMELDLEALM